MEAWLSTHDFNWPPRHFCLVKQAVLGSFPELVGIDGAVDAGLQSSSADYRPHFWCAAPAGMFCRLRLQSGPWHGSGRRSQHLGHDWFKALAQRRPDEAK